MPVYGNVPRADARSTAFTTRSVCAWRRLSGRDPDDVAAYDEWLETIFVGGAKPLRQSIEIREYDPHWPGLYAREADRVRPC